MRRMSLTLLCAAIAFMSAAFGQESGIRQTPLVADVYPPFYIESGGVVLDGNPGIFADRYDPHRMIQWSSVSGLWIGEPADKLTLEARDLVLDVQRGNINAYAAAFVRLLVDGYEMARIDAPEGAGETALLLWRDGRLQRVTVGEPNSAGAGYRVLRVPNE